MTGDRAALLSLVEAIPNARVLCVGDIMLDHFYSGTVDRISPEAPVPVLLLDADSERTMLGGVGNVVRNVRGLGARAAITTVVGDDVEGTHVAELIRGLDVDPTAIERDRGRRTSVKRRYMTGSHQLLRTDQETAIPLDANHRDALVSHVKHRISDQDVLVLSDYGKGVLADGVAETLIRVARDAGKPVIVDPKGRDYRVYDGADVITPNRRELAEASGMPTVRPADVIAATRQLIDRHRFGAVLATLGGDGMVLAPADGHDQHLAVTAREVFDVSGAGDTVVAALAAALAAGGDLYRAAALANVAAGIVVGKVGTAVAYADDLIRALHHEDLSDAEAKVLNMRPAGDRVAKWRRGGLKVGFTNGCFDLLHPGHVSLLAQARAACDKLVVGLNTDASVRRLKGDGRPVQGETARATVLASLATVDMVVPFGEDTPLALIEALRPDVLVKGADYTIETVVGADTVQKYGGRVVLARLEPGHSTTATIARMNR